MASSTQVVSGLMSGLDWRSIVDQLYQVEHRRVDLVEDKKTESEDKLAEWQSVNTMLLSLQSKASVLSTEDAFNVFSSTTTSDTSTSASNILTATTSSTASSGLYSITVDHLAESQKISSNRYTSTSTAIGVAGDILVSGKVVNLVATDTLTDIKDKINAANTGTDPSGVTATIVMHSSTDYHLVLTADETGEDGLSVLEGSSANTLRTLGFISSSKAIKNATSDGMKSDLFAHSTSTVDDILGLSSAATGSVTIGGQSVTINLATQSITTIASNIDALSGVSASVVSEVVDGTTKYRIDISGTTTYTDDNNVLQTLGIVRGTYVEVNEMHTGDVKYDENGDAITSGTLWQDIFTGAIRGTTQNTKVAGGYITSGTRWNEINTTGGPGNDIDNGDTVRIVGKNHNGDAVDQTYTISDNTEELSNFLNWVEDQFGDSTTVNACFDPTGRLIVEDLQSGSSELSISSATATGTALTFGTFGNNITSGDTITISGTKHNGSAATTTTYTMNTAEALSAGSGFLSKIEDAFGGAAAVDAYISDGTDGNTAGQLVIKDLDDGDSQLSVTIVCNNQGGGTLNFGTISMTTEGRNMEVNAGENAEFTVDNVVLTSASNTVTDVIEGVTLNLVGGDEDATTITLKVERDLGTIKSKINEMVSAYNEIMTYINTQFNYDEETNAVGGILFGDGTLSSVKSELINTITKTITGASSEYNRLALIGISLDDDVVLTVDDEDLTDALETNFEHVRKLFSAYGYCANSLLQYASHTDNTQGGTYSVDITQVATRTTLTGLTDFVAENETVTIEDYNAEREATVSLTASMNIDDVVNAINSELATETTEQLQGSLTNPGKTIATTWSAVAGADDDDVISFSGVKRNGLSVSGSYQISDTDTDTIGDLLESIENIFDDEVSASLDTDGRLVITDNQTGDSQLSFSIDTATAGITGVDFGTVSTTTQGRYAINITASKTGNKLVLTHNTYGTGNIIVASESGSALGLTGASPVLGVNVAGTINGVSATGSGQTLTLSSSGNNADGLSITYTGSTTVTDADFVLTLGVAELLNRQLGFITDTSDGYVAFKQDSLSTSIDDYTDQIEDMEAQLDLKMERYIDQFVKMEVTLGKLQNISAWLSSQISGMFG